MKNKKNMIIVLSGVTLLFAAIFFLMTFNGNKLSLIINEEKIGSDEYLRLMNSKKYDVSVYFKKKYRAKINEKFWESEFEGIKPYEKLADETLKALIYQRTVYNLAKEHEYIDSSEYIEIKRRFNEENSSRKEKIENGQVVYGLTEYPIDLFIGYEMNSFKQLYCNDENNLDMQVTEEDVNKYYESHEGIIDENGNKLSLNEARANMIQKIREERYDQKIEERIKNSEVKTDKQSLYDFTLKNIKN